MNPLFSTDRGALGRIEFRPLDPGSDLPMVHDWVNRDYARFWGMQGMSLPEVASAYRDKLGEVDYSIHIGMLLPTRESVFLCEIYNPVADELGKYYNSGSTDRGLHFIRAPQERTIRDFSWHMFMAVTEFIFADPSIGRVVLEPDIANRKMISLLLQCGYALGPVIHMRHKTARFVSIGRERFTAVNAAGTRLDLEYSPNPLTLGYHRLAGRIRRRIRRGIW
jgi:Acetyltransferase (GNAT) domain